MESITDTVSSKKLATYTRPVRVWTARPAGNLPTATVATTESASVSITDTLPSPQLATYRREPCAARSSGASPTASVARTVPATGSMTETVSEAPLATKTRGRCRPAAAGLRPTPTARPAGPSPTAIEVVVPVTESMRATESSWLRATNSAPPGASAMPEGSPASGNVPTSAFVCRSTTPIESAAAPLT